MPTVADIAALLNVPVSGDSSRQVKGVATLADAGTFDISFLSSDAHVEQYLATRAVAVIVDRSVKLQADGAASQRGPANASLMIVDDADLALAETLRVFARPIPRPAPGIDPAARVSADASLADACCVGPFASVPRESIVPEGTTVAGNISADTTLLSQPGS